MGDDPMNLRLAISSSLVACLTMWTSEAFAGGTWTNVTVTQVQPCTSEGCPPNGTVLVTLSASSTGGPTCATNKTTVAIDMSNSAGQFAAGVMQTARLVGTTLAVVTGAGSCSIFSGLETLSAVEE